VESLSTVSWTYLVDLPVDDSVSYFYKVFYRVFDERPSFLHEEFL